MRRDPNQADRYLLAEHNPNNDQVVNGAADNSTAELSRITMHTMRNAKIGPFSVSLCFSDIRRCSFRMNESCFEVLIKLALGRAAIEYIKKS